MILYSYRHVIYVHVISYYHFIKIHVCSIKRIFHTSSLQFQHVLNHSESSSRSKTGIENVYHSNQK